MRRSVVAAGAVVAGLLLTHITPSFAAPAPLSVPKKLTVSVTSNSARLSWGLTKGAAPSRILIQCSVGGAVVISTSAKKSPITLSSLNSATSYNCKLVSVLGKSRGAAKLITFTTASGLTVSSRPFNVSATAVGESATITWNAPSNNGGTPITSYVVTSTPASAGCTSITTSCTVTGLSAGVSYTFNVVARNSVGTSLVSISSNAVLPIATSVGLDNVQTVAGDGYIDISWHLIRDVDNVEISWGSESAVIAGNTTSYRVNGVANCTSQTITLKTISNSLTSNGVTAIATPGGSSGIAGSVQNLSATATSRAVHVSFAAPQFTGFSDTPITGYVVTATAGAATSSVTVGATATSADIADLTNDVEYTISVAAVNKCGTHVITPADRITATPSWGDLPSTIIDLSDVNAVTKHTLVVGGSVGYRFTAIDIFDVAGTYFTLEPQCSTNATVWADCAVTLSLKLFDLSGNQLNTIQYGYADWYGTGLVPLRPEQPLVADEQYILVVKLLASSATHTAVDVFSPALVW